MSQQAMMNVGAQTGAKAGRFALPIAQQTHRGHDQGRLRQATCLFFGQDVRQGLQGFAQAHVVGQDTGQLVLPQKLQPVQALMLIRPQGRLQIGGHAHFGQAFKATHLLQQIHQALGTRPGHILAQRGGGTQGFQA